MAYSPIENRFLDSMAEAQFPTAPEPMVEDPVQLAAGPSDTVTDSPAPIRVGRAGVPYRPPSMKDITEPLGGLMDMGASTLKGVTQGFVGLPGDLEGLARTAINLMGGAVGENTALPTTEEVKAWLDKFPMLRIGDGKNTYESIGEVGAPGGQLKAGKAVLKGAKALAPKVPKNIPVGASTDVVGGGTQAMLQAGKASAPVSDIGFYSAVEDAALNLQRKSGSGQAMLNDITKAANVKADEIKWIGLDDFLKGKKNVTREEVQQFIADNKVDIQEVTLADVKAAPVSTENITDYFDETLTPNGDEARGIFNFSFTEKGANEPTTFTAYEMKGGAVELYDNRGNFIDEYRTLTDAREHVINESEFSASQADGKTKFGTWTLPGGENYREILLTMPSKSEVVDIPVGRGPYETRQSNGQWYIVDRYGEWGERGYQTRAAAESDFPAQTTMKVERDTGNSYRSSHWDEPNVLAHIRVNDRVDADGKKMLLVEEVQSDWHQAGRDKGYASDVGPKVSDAEYKRGVELQQRDVRGEGLTDAERQEMQDILRRHDASVPGTKVPDAPMKDTWYQLALKRVLKYAADNGYDRIGLTTGSRQAERYDLSKQIDSLIYSKESDGSYSIVANKGGREIVKRDSVPEANLSDLVGKEIAQKMTKAEGKDIGMGEKEFTGLDLRVGGEGMKKYYDEVYPQFLQKYGKKWGAKVGETKIELHGDLKGFMPAKDMQTETVRYVDITPQMREGVGKGQPLFTATGLGTGTAATMQDKEQK